MFDNITVEEFGKLKDAISQITILIAGADGKIDKEEVEWGEKITKIRSYSYAAELKPFYKEVGMDYQEKVNYIIENYPRDEHERTELLSDKLKQLNPILSKMDDTLARLLYQSYVSFAEHVAKSSGGFLRFLSVSQNEKHLMNLPMIDPVN